MTVPFTTQGCTTWTVPTGVSSVQIQATGAAGGRGGGGNGATGGAGGLGDRVSGTLSGLTGGPQQLDVCVNQAGGALDDVFSGVGGGRGGGASGVSFGSDFSQPVLVAGGGGGGGGSIALDGGAGGSAGMPQAQAGSAGTGTGVGVVGGGGGGNNTAMSGGPGGAGEGASFNGHVGGAFTAAGPGRGGNGGSNDGSGGGGGGAGYFGGGGGASGAMSGGAGGGGTDFCAASISSCTVAAGAGTQTTAGSGAGAARVTLTYMLPDTIPPTANPTQSPAANAAGWNNVDVTVHWNWADDPDGSGLDAQNCTTSSTTSTGEGRLTLTGTCTDVAGNTGMASSTVQVDKTAPTVSVTGVADKAAYNLGNVPTAGCSTTDSLSGVATSASLQLTGGNSSGGGTFTATCNGAIDKAGNAATAVSATYTVGYSFSGFLAPVNNPPTVNTGRAGRAYPVKFRLTTANGGFISSLSAVRSIAYQSTNCGAFRSDPTDALETDTTGASGLRYDSTANQYVYTWATPSTAGCYTVFVTLDSGQVFPAYFNLS